jgi:hypothetical protein
MMYSHYLMELAGVDIDLFRDRRIDYAIVCCRLPYQVKFILYIRTVVVS